VIRVHPIFGLRRGGAFGVRCGAGRGSAPPRCNLASRALWCREPSRNLARRPAPGLIGGYSLVQVAVDYALLRSAGSLSRAVAHPRAARGCDVPRRVIATERRRDGSADPGAADHGEILRKTENGGDRRYAGAAGLPAPRPGRAVSRPSPRPATTRSGQCLGIDARIAAGGALGAHRRAFLLPAYITSARQCPVRGTSGTARGRPRQRNFQG
jgi:hypothetical protein